MELRTFAQMINDKQALDFTKLKYKYGDGDLKEYINTLKENFYYELPLLDFKSNKIVMLPSKINMTTQLTRSLSARHSKDKYSIHAMEDEIISTLSIEKIDSTRESVRGILNGRAPSNSDEDKAYGIKRGLDFISEPTNRITEDNLYRLYMLTVGEFLEEDNKLLLGNKYRHDVVYVTGKKGGHEGLNNKLLPEYLGKMIDFIHEEDTLDQIVKSVIIHYYFAYLHPYFDGNGRMSRLIQLWYLVQMGYLASLYIPFSTSIHESKNLYYKAFVDISENYRQSDVLDVTPFIQYFINNVFSKINQDKKSTDALDSFKDILQEGEITAKEKDLFYYVLSAYGTNEFSTKQLEKEYNNVAYATVRSFVLKLEKKGLLTSQKYGNRVKYQIR